MLVDDLLAPQVEEVDRIVEEPAELRAGDREIDLRGVLGARLGREHHRRPAGDGEPQLAEESRVLEIGALVARAVGKDVSQPAGDREQVPPLQDQLLGAGGLRQRAQVLVPEQLGGGDGGE